MSDEWLEAEKKKTDEYYTNKVLEQNETISMVHELFDSMDYAQEHDIVKEKSDKYWFRRKILRAVKALCDEV